MANTDTTMPPEVAEAIHAIDTGNGVFVNGDDGVGGDKWKIVRAHLHRLAEENARLLSIQIGMHRDVCANALRAEKAEAHVQELETLNRELDFKLHDQELLAKANAEHASQRGQRVQELERENGELQRACTGGELSILKDLASARETIKRLNRRVQMAEAGVAEKVKAAVPGSLGRALANAAASKAEAERDALKARIAEAPKTSAYADGDDGLTIGCGPHILACMDESEIGECFAIVKLENGE